MKVGSMQGTGGAGRIASDPRLLAAAAAGLVAAVLALLAFRGLAGGSIALWLVPLPLFLAGLGFGPVALAGAVLVAALALLLVGGSFGVGIFLGVFALPVAALVLAARRSGPTGLAFALLGLMPAFGVLLAAMLLADEPGGLQGAMQQAAEMGLARMGVSLSPGLVEAVVRAQAAAIGLWLALALLANATGAAHLLVRGKILAAAPAWREARLPGWYPVLPAVALGFWLAADAGTDAVELSTLLALLIPVFLHGLAALHRATVALRGRPFVLGGAYLALLLLSVPAAAAATGYGLFDIITRARRATPPRS